MDTVRVMQGNEASLDVNGRSQHICDVGDFRYPDELRMDG